MANKKNIKPPVIVDEEIVTEEPVVEETVTEEPVAEEKVVETKPVEKPAKKIVKGKVFNCSGLNVRKAPSTSADIVAVLNAGTEIIIEESGDPNWFKTPSGFVMKAYIQKI